MRAELVTAGEAFEDLVFFDLPRLPRLGEELKTSSFARVPGGGAITTAVTAARRGVRAGVISAVSPMTRDRLRTAGVVLRDLRHPDEAPALSVALSTRGERTFVTYNGVNDRLEARLLREVPRIQASHLHCAFYPARCSRWLPVVTALQRRGLTVSWDFGWNPSLNDDSVFSTLLRTLDLVFVNEAEARLYARVRSLASAFTWWRATGRATVVKLGRRGAAYLSEEAVLRSAARRVRAVDTTGAGDAFNGGYLAVLIRGGSPAACLRAGNDAGGRATTQVGGS